MTELTPQFFRSDMFFLMAGPCAIESEYTSMVIAEQVKSLCDKYSIPYIYKASYRKANRSSIHSFTGIGDKKALSIIKKIGKTFQVPTVTDIHLDHEAEMAAEYVDMLQIPAFLCRQTSLIQAAAATGKWVNIKKGQFLNGEAMIHAVTKMRESGNEKILLTDRGNTFGYQDLIVDYRNIPVMQSFNVPVVMDCTHSLQQPNQSNGITGGKPKFIETIAKAAIATGVDGLFVETHPSPHEALSDGANMLALDKLDDLLFKLVKIRKAVML
ncbi:MAG: 3-deoxy-8-phosphooctulonate synthase [Saprospiraceae bacterium]|nr:3-deoxy-8-phosphooctulonate synthase [Saprospiraceae bacterium]